MSISLVIIDNTVLFPAPFGPIREIILPFSISKDTLSTTFVFPYFLVKFLTSIIVFLPYFKNIFLFSKVLIL